MRANARKFCANLRPRAFCCFFVAHFSTDMDISQLTFEERFNIQPGSVLSGSDFALALSTRCSEVFEFLDRGEPHAFSGKYSFVTGFMKQFKVHVNVRAGIAFGAGSNKKKRVLVITHLAIFPESRGGFGELIKMFLQVVGFSDSVDLIKFECLHNPAFEEKLLARGWIQDPADGDYYLSLEKIDKDVTTIESDEDSLTKAQTSLTESSLFKQTT